MESTLIKQSEKCSQQPVHVHASISMNKFMDVAGYHIGPKMCFEIELDLHTSKYFEIEEVIILHCTCPVSIYQCLDWYMMRFQQGVLNFVMFLLNICNIQLTMKSLNEIHV